MLFILLFIIFLYIIFDLNYFVRTLFTVISGKIYQKETCLGETTTIYGMCTLQDCDLNFKSIRLARLVRELDFARYHFYDRTGIYQRSKQLKIKSLQGCTLTRTFEPVPLFSIYKINTKLAYWDDRSLFFEHEVVSLRDGKTKYFLVSRQHAIGEDGESTEALLRGLQGSERRPDCPEYLKCWLKSMEITSHKLRKQIKSN